ncbi:hypothetical protein BXT86_00660 [candidate division WOR-3 bacterium 4484_100]|uniref:Putative zinc-finger domain-containing protein n=1 Tax=candidate division WOR-3 bacterium 4484_100 TaxID=1936077 RepID=A0A1V4QII5_UNCW3|nr:MAG: hypothetical protein BXT86_00660 [candidate division WOR-3 bacterium 4484_100]
MKMNSCPDKARLIAYRLNILKPEEHRWIEAHIAECKKCQQMLKVEIEIDNFLSTPMDPGPIEDSVIQRLHLYQRIVPSPRWLYPAWIFLNTLVFIAVGIAIWAVLRTQSGNIFWLNDFIDLLRKGLNYKLGAIIMNSIGLLFLLVSLIFAFREKFLRRLI